MAPGGRREGGHGAWVKKAPAGGEKKDEEVDFKGREGKGGKARSKGERGRREDDEAKGKGRAKGKHKKEEGRESNSGEEEAEDSGNALLKMLKGNAQSTKRFSYSKAELLKIATLPAANVKPPDLDPIVDKDNKDSVLLIRIQTHREKEEPEQNGEDRRRSNPTRQARTEGEARGTEAEAEEARPAEEEDDEEKAQAFEKWLVRNMDKLEAAKADLTAKAAATAAAGSAGSAGASGSTGSTMTAAAPKWPPTASAMAAAMAGKSGSASNYMSMLQQQAGAGAAASGMSPAHAMQAAAYMQAMTQMQLAAARNSYSSQTWNAYNQYLNPYMTGAYGAGYGMDPFTAAAASQAAASNLTEAMQAKLGLGALNQQRMAAMKAAATAKAAKATAKAKAKAPQPKTPPAKAGPKTSPLTALDGLKAPAKSGEEEDEAGCSQS